VFVDGRVLVLSELASSIVSHVPEAPRGVELDVLVAHLVSEFGEPEVGHPVEIARASIAALVDGGVLADLEPVP
jgi:hypothetical protein